MRNNIKRIFSPQALVCGCIIIFFGVLAFLFPYSGDDWAWGSEIGLSRFETFFADYNGRYLGNLLVMTLTRSKAVKVVAMALCYFLACFLCHRYSGSKRIYTLLFAVLAFLLMPRYTFAQSVVWTSGFTNYVPSALISVGYLLIIKNITGQDVPQYPRFMFLATLAMGFVGAPFMENIALFNICLGIAVIGYTLIKFRKLYLTQICFLVGAVAGAVWMFLNGAYHAVATGEDDYRTAATGIDAIVEQALSNTKIITYNLFTNNLAVCAVASVFLAVLVIGFVKKSDSLLKRVGAILLLVVNVLSLAPFVYGKSGMVLAFTRAYVQMFSKSSVLKVLCMVLFSLTTVAIVLLCVRKHHRFKMLLPLYCIPVVVAPLLVVTPIGPRCFFITHLMVMVFLVELLYYLSEGACIGGRRALYGCIGGLLVAQIVFLLTVFVPVYNYDTRRAELAQIQSKNNESAMIVCQLPDDGYVWCDSLEMGVWPYRYKLFYELDQDIPLTVVSVEEFDEYYNEYIKEHK